MFSDYWWLIVIAILVVMIVFPKKKSKNNSEGPKLKTEPFLSNLNTIASYYVGLN